jgi:outer membrane protein OmpA-like peptidoglycan-associated protein
VLEVNTLRPEAREKLAKMSGIILSHPGLHLEIGGHTDSVGSDDFNQKLSEQRAESARKYLQDAGIATDNLVARGFGEVSRWRAMMAMPVAARTAESK